ncbi:hypothetical protein [Micromonospora sp. CP22]|uniref:hypothetical protein n=1 Tax=Micromonospora sp. CP22 TaxID=2580517 RepID=UPI0018AD1307
MGKTALALRWAHAVRQHFPDGQLYANLRGYDPGQPSQPEQVLDRFLRALALLLCDGDRSTVASTWGNRRDRGRTSQRWSLPTIDEGIRKFEEIVRRKLRQHYYVTGVGGDLPIDRVLGLLSHDDLQVVSKALLRRLVRDDDFRRLFAQDAHLYTPGVGHPIDPHGVRQEALFDL